METITAFKLTSRNKERGEKKTESDGVKEREEGNYNGQGERKYLRVSPSSTNGMLIGVEGSALLASQRVCLCDGVKRSDMAFAASAEGERKTAHKERSVGIP